MPTLVNTVPKYRKHKASGQAVVTIGGFDHYLGPFNSKASRIEYDRVIGEWITAGRPSSLARPNDLTIASESPKPIVFSITILAVSLGKSKFSIGQLKQLPSWKGNHS
jgi:hypothetical protein